MIDQQELANGIGASLREAEAAVADGDTVTASTALQTLHEQLGHVFHVVNAMRDDLGEDPLNWDQIAGNGAARGGGATNSGGTPKGPPPPPPGG